MGGGSSIILEPGRFSASSVKNGAFVYYSSEIRAGEGFAVTVYADRGDPNLFVSNQDSKPTAKNSMWKSTHYGRDMIMVPPTDPKYKPGKYYVGVQGAGNARFNVVAGPIIKLNYGIPYSTTVQKGKYQFFIIEHENPAAVLNVWVAPPDGRAARAPVSIFASRSLVHPYRGSNTWSSHRGDPLDITPKHPSFKPGTFYVSMIGDNVSPVNVEITAAALVTLTDGSPTQGYIKEGSYSYYSFFAGNPNADVTIFLDPLPGPDGTVGDPDLYICSKTIHPTQDKHTWKSDREGSDFATIPHNHPMFKVGNFYIGVQGATDTSYVITAETKITLRDGVPYSDWCRGKEIRHFEAIVDGGSPSQCLVITLVPATKCDVELLISRNPRPTRENAIWTFDIKGGGGICIPASDPNYNAGTFFISTSLSVDTSFSLTSTCIPEHGTISLLKSVPLREKLSKGERKHYTLVVSGEDAKFQDLHISMSPWHTNPMDCTVYVARDIRPTVDDAMWTGDFVEGGTLSVLHADPRFSEGEYHITVLANGDSEFLITQMVSHEEVAAIAIAHKFARNHRQRKREKEERARSGGLSPGGDVVDDNWEKVRRHHRHHRRKHKHRMATAVSDALMVASRGAIDRHSAGEFGHVPASVSGALLVASRGAIDRHSAGEFGHVPIREDSTAISSRSALVETDRGTSASFGGTEDHIVQDFASTVKKSMFATSTSTDEAVVSQSASDLERELFGESSPEQPKREESKHEEAHSDARSLAQQTTSTKTATDLYATSTTPTVPKLALSDDTIPSNQPAGAMTTSRKAHVGTTAAAATAALATARVSKPSGASSYRSKHEKRRFGLDEERSVSAPRERVAMEAPLSRRSADRRDVTPLRRGM